MLIDVDLDICTHKDVKNTDLFKTGLYGDSWVIGTVNIGKF
ncbi:hypothetical protein J2S01_000368 [Pectinatus haikarae]|uniref:Uncharacterized protein n=1 Tax=Pectinatus haikarae TaxID=349096 RepID=A0ABT9Y4B6_9FIRM|nr:hypothetical protein [Pectinatus haikarae]